MHAAVISILLIGQVANGPDGVIIDYAQRLLPLKATHVAAENEAAPEMWPTAPAVATPTRPVAPVVARPAAAPPRERTQTATAAARPAPATVATATPASAASSPAPASTPALAPTVAPARPAAAPSADAPLAPALREAVSAPTEPEPIKPAQDEPRPATLAATAAGAEEPAEFVSKRSELGKPRAIVPDVIARPTVSPAPQSSLGGWSKLLAGALFLASLGLIGYRHRQKTHAAAQDTGAFAGSWLPPRAPGKARPARSGGMSWQDSDDIFITGDPANAVLVKEAKVARRAAARPAALDPADDVPFHDVVERRVQMHNAGKRETLVHTAPIRRAGSGARFKVGEQDYGRIIDLAESGRTAHEIAQELGLPLRAVSSLVRGKTGSKPAEASERQHAH